MRRKLILVLVLLYVCLLSGCVYWKTTTLFVKGDDVRAPFGSINPISGKGVKGTVIRQVYWTDEKGRKLPELSDVKVEGDEVDKTVGGLEIKK